MEQLENQYRPRIEAQKEQLNKFIDGNSEIMDVLAKQITNINQKPAIEGAERGDSADGELFYGVDLNSGIEPAVIKELGYPPMEEVAKIKMPEEILEIIEDVKKYTRKIGLKMHI